MERDHSVTWSAESVAERPRYHLFTVRVWKHDAAGDVEYRGSVQEVVSGANCSFRDWSGLASFMMAEVEDDESARAERTDGGT